MSGRRQVVAMVREAEEHLREFDFKEAAELYAVAADLVEERGDPGDRERARDLRGLARRALVADWTQRRYPETHVRLDNIVALAPVRKRGGRLLYDADADPHSFIVTLPWPNAIGAVSLHVRVSRRGRLRRSG